MAIQDILKQIFSGASQLAPQLAQTIDTARMNAMHPEQVYAQQQEDERQKAQLAQQLNLHNSMTPYETQSLALQGSNASRAATQQDQENHLKLLSLLGGGAVKDADEGDPNAVSFGGRSLVPVAPGDQAGMFTYTPTDDDLKSYPWLASAKKGVPMPVKEFPAFLQDMSKLQKNNPQANAQYEQTLLGQLDQLVPSQDPMKDNYKFMIHDALTPGPGQDPDHKRALGVLDDIRKQAQEVETEKRKQALQFSPEAVHGQALLAGAKAGAEADAQDAVAAKNLPDETLDYWWKQVKAGAVSYNDVLSRFDKSGKERFANYVAKLGDPAPIALDQPSRTRLQNLEPVIDSLNSLKQRLISAGMDKQTAPGSLAAGRLLYGLGAGVDSGGLISQMEMDRLRGAAQALPGGRAALQTFNQAQIHNPSAWKDSGKLALDKIGVMLEYLQNQKSYLYKYGAKSGVVQGLPEGEGTGDTDQPDFIVKDGKVVANPTKGVKK